LASSLIKKYSIVLFFVILSYGFGYYLLFNATNIFIVCILSSLIALCAYPFASRWYAGWILQLSGFFTIYGCSVFVWWLKSPILFWLAIVPLMAAHFGVVLWHALTATVLSFLGFAILSLYFHQSTTPELNEGHLQIASSMALCGIISVNLFFKYLYDSGLSMQHKQLQEAKSKLLEQEKLAVAGSIAAGVAHEIGNHLQVISSAVRLIQSADGDVPNHLNDGIAAIKLSVGNAKSILTNLSLVAHGQKEATLISLKDVVNSVLIILRGYTLEKVSVGVQGPPEIQVFFPEPILIQILIHLLINAFQAMEGIEHQKVEISWNEERGQIWLTVADCGKGISDADSDKIFDEYYTTKVKGTGLGLHLVKKMLKEYGGEISLTNRVNPTAFTLFFPKGVSHEGDAS
jgi:signal transduction histidine kinase